MIKKIATGALRVGRVTVFAAGLAVVLALVVGVTSTALAANGKPFILGKGNVATKVSKLVKRGAGPALELRVRGGQPPLKVNSGKKVNRLNVDQVDGKSAANFLAKNGKAADANKLDGKDSTDFLQQEYSIERDSFSVAAGARQSRTISCQPGQVALHGGWRDLRATTVITGSDAVHASDNRPELWRFEFVNNNEFGNPAGDDTVELEVTCLGPASQ
ncbi:MAG: hypothetical protein ACFB50_00035 [Rubrobacteraceae bacterium]